MKVQRLRIAKDRLLEIMQKYIHLQQEFDDKGNLKSERIIFPRYHQLDVVTKLLADVKENGSGTNYLIQHSAGSGKSNSIAWLAHRLSGLHNDMDEKIFQSVIIVTDRKVLDSQLQNTVYQTLQMFGIPYFNEETGKNGYRPFHIYSMRQAIEEGFILDVLQNYMTYKMYYKIIKIIDDDPELDTTQGSKAILNYETLHPHNISQKTAIMLYHFMNVTRHKMGGKAKAMVVTPSRLHAVRYVQEFKRQIQEKGYDLDVLVAFSGEVTDNGTPYTEETMNKTKDGEVIKEKALPAAFHTDDYGILVVAEKYQTGFDEPLLHTMFVDKKLSGVKAVQVIIRIICLLSIYSHYSSF